MHRRHEKRNTPIELLRALVTVVDTGSFTKAADALNLTQSAISAQIARLGDLLGGSMFAKGPGISPTKRGFLALKYARRMVAINDELLASAGSGSAPGQTVIGLTLWLGQQYLSSVFERCSCKATGAQVAFRCDYSEQLLRDLDFRLVGHRFLMQRRGLAAECLGPMVGENILGEVAAPLPLSWRPDSTGCLAG